MLKKPKNIILSGVLAVGLICGSVAYRNNVKRNENTTTNNKTSLLSYSKTDLANALSELKYLKIRTYSDLSWGKGGRKRYFGSWKKLSEYNFYPGLSQKCLTRFAVLITQGENVKYNNCIILSGIWQNPYEKEMLTNADHIDIDHIVPLKDTWSSGANHWTQAKREKYANTPFVLLISKEYTNEHEKIDKSPDKWMPQINKCGYIIKWIDIKFKYKLTTTISESNFIKLFIKTCK